MRPQDTTQGKSFSSAEPTALASNVIAAVGMADVVRTTLGPRGLDKLLVDQLGNRVITNDGYTILVSLKTTHPVSKLLVEIAERQEVSVGDGTTSTVIMAADMLKEGYRVTTEYGIHPSRLLAELDEGVSLVTEYLNKAAVPIGSLDDPMIQMVLETATASKLDGAQLSRLILEAIHLLGREERTDLRHGIILLRRLGEDLFLDGIAIEHLPMETSSVNAIGQPKVCLIRDSLKFPLQGSQTGDTPNPDRERESVLSKLTQHGINLIISNAPEIDPSFRIGLISRKIALIRVSTEELGLLSRSLTTPMFYATQMIGETQVPHFTSESIILDEEKGLTILKAPGSGVIATLIIGGATIETSKERMRTCVDGISGVHFALKGGVVAGSGIAELNAARFLERTMVERGVQKVGFNILMKGLESVSRQILDNSGYNGYDMLIRLMSKDDGIGVDVNTGEFVPMVNHGIIDPLITKIHAIQIAAHLTKTILKIDRNLIKDDGS